MVAAVPPDNSGSKKPKGNGISPRRFFRSTKGNLFDAYDYGHKAWPIGRKNGNKSQPPSK